MRLKGSLALVLMLFSLGCDMQRPTRTRKAVAQYNIIADCPDGRALYTAEAFFTLEKRADLVSGEVVIFPTTCRLTITEIERVER